MAEAEFRDALDFIRRDYEVKRYPLRFFQTDHREKLERATLFLNTLPSVGDALIDCYLNAFVLEGKIPDQDDATWLDHRLEILFAGNWKLDTGKVDLNTIENEIRELEGKACQKLGAKIHKMKLEAAKPIPPQHGNYNLSVGTINGPVQVGPGNTQNFTGVRYKSGKPHIRWSQLQPTGGLQRISEVGDVEVTEENIADAIEIGGDPWVELLEINTFGTKVKKYALGFFTPGA